MRLQPGPRWVLLASALVAAMATADTPGALTLEAAVERALTLHPRVAAAREAWVAARQTVRARRVPSDPKLRSNTKA